MNSSEQPTHRRQLRRLALGIRFHILRTPFLNCCDLLKNPGPRFFRLHLPSLQVQALCPVLPHALHFRWTSSRRCSPPAHNRSPWKADRISTSRKFPSKHDPAISYTTTLFWGGSLDKPNIACTCPAFVYQKAFLRAMSRGVGRHDRIPTSAHNPSMTR
jgi:hypothetical protein